MFIGGYVFQTYTMRTGIDLGGFVCTTKHHGRAVFIVSFPRCGQQKSFVCRTSCHAQKLQNITAESLTFTTKTGLMKRVYNQMSWM